MNEREEFTTREIGSEITKLDDVIDVSREIPELYEMAIEGQRRYIENRGGAPKTEHSIIWMKLLRHCDEEKQAKEGYPKETLRYFRDKLRGQCFVDLGSGLGFHPNMLAFAQVCGARTYIGVDIESPLYASKELNPSVSIYEGSEYGLRRIEMRADMLDFVARLKDCSVNFTINGIDDVVINDVPYKAALAQEITRATKRGGIIFGYISEELFELMGLLQEKGQILPTLGNTTRPVEKLDFQKHKINEISKNLSFFPIGSKVFEKT